MGKIYKNREVDTLKKARVLNNENGFFKFILSMAVLAFLIYAGIQFGMPYYRYSSFKTDAKELATISLGDLGKTKAGILEKAQELKLPLTEKDVEVIQSGKLVRVKAAWSETVDLLGVYQKTINFTLDVEA